MTVYSEDTTGTVPEWTRGDRMRKAREAAGLSQQELAEAIGVSRRSISAYETNGTLKKPVLLSWALRTGVPLPWLRDGLSAEEVARKSEYSRRRAHRRRKDRLTVTFPRLSVIEGWAA